MTHRPFISSALSLGLLSVLLSGCAEAERRVGSSATSVEEAQAVPVVRPAMKTVRPRGTPRAPAVDTSQREPVEAPIVAASAVPTPQQIFDFHPPGSAPGSFRQPFIIDPNDGPLTADVQRSAMELRNFNAEQKAGTAIAGSKRCSEMDVAQDKRGCVGTKPQATTSVLSDPLALR